MSIAAGANAQLPDGSVFPDFTRVDINGRTHHLYDELDSGKTVIIDISATWCHPCWLYHQTGELDSMWAKHGPRGEAGVNASTTDDMVVYWIQGETQSGMAQLTFNTIGSGAQQSTFNHTTYTEGNWVAGTHYYTICDSILQGPFNTAWQIAYFPTVYMICRDRLTKELTQPTEAEAYAEVLASCPTTAPSATTNAKTVAYNGADYFVCNAAPKIKFQNYGANTITAATITIKDGAGTTVATVPWTGSLASYSVTTVTVPSFAGTSFGGYKYSVTVSGDTDPADDVSIDSVFKVYSAANADAIPANEGFEGSVPYKRSFSSTDGNIGFGVWDASMIGADGTTTNASSVVFLDYNSEAGQTQTFVMGNFNTTSAANLTLEFDVAYAQYSSSTNDALAVKVSTNCGASWTTPWNQSGATLATAPVTSSGPFYPRSASQWKHVTVSLASATNANTMVQLVNTSAYGNNMWVDNVKLWDAPVSVNEVGNNALLNIAPNPARDMTELTLSLQEATTVNVQVYDAVGRVVNTISQQMNAGVQTVNINTANLAAGVYNVVISAGASHVTKQLSVIK